MEVHFDYLFCDATELVPVILVNIRSWRYLGKEDKNLAFCSASLLEGLLLYIDCFIYIYTLHRVLERKQRNFFLTLHIKFYYFDI